VHLRAEGLNPVDRGVEETEGGGDMAWRRAAASNEERQENNANHVLKFYPKATKCSFS